jgi:hypothetical protein
MVSCLTSIQEYETLVIRLSIVAQEVEKVLPEVVGSGPDGEKTLAYTELIPVLVEAVKELKVETDQLRAENDALRGRLEVLERARDDR